MLNQRWMFKNTNIKGKSVYQERVGYLISKSIFAFKLHHLTYQEYCLEFMFCLFIIKDFETKGERKKRKRESVQL